MLKKTLKISAILLTALLVIAFTLPFLFKGKILAIAREQVNKNVRARVDFSDVNISLFRHFPRLAVGLENLQIIGTDVFSKDTLISANRIDVAINILSLFGGNDISIYSITIDKPRIHAIVNKDGLANWNISLPDTASASKNAGGSFHMHLQSYQINDGYISYSDIPGDKSCEIEHLDHSGNGDFSSDLFTLHTKTSAGSVSFVYTKIPYIADAQASITADLEVDNKTQTYRFKTDDIHLNDLQFGNRGKFPVCK